MRVAFAVIVVLAACSFESELAAPQTDAQGSGGSTADEVMPEPAAGNGVSDPPTRTLHNPCGGVDWQRIHGWLMIVHKEPEIGDAAELERCVQRYAGWVTNEADAAGVSRASVYATLAATGQCAADRDYDGALVPGALCVAANADRPELAPTSCVAEMASSRAFGIRTVARALGTEAAIKKHDRDVPLMATYAATGAIACDAAGGRWKLAAPAGYVDTYVRTYNAYKALSAEPPACRKRIVVTVALYTGMDDPGVDGVSPANGCWTFERVSKMNPEWKICNYDGTVYHGDGTKWVYDDTSTAHTTATETSRINACKAGTPVRGYVYMANRGDGWPKRVTTGVRAHFAEVYSSQFEVDDQFTLWKNSGKPGEPMIHVGEPTTTATRIRSATARACAEVGDGGFLGIYVYPESLRGARMSAMVEAINACTKAL